MFSVAYRIAILNHYLACENYKLESTLTLVSNIDRRTIIVEKRNKFLGSNIHNEICTNFYIKLFINTPFVSVTTCRGKSYVILFLP